MRPDLSVILLAYQSEDKIKEACTALTSAFEKENIHFEIIIVDDGSTDGTLGQAQQIQKENSNIRCISLSKNYTSPYAQFAGLSVCKGRCAAPMPDDFQRPIAHLIAMYRMWQNGAKVVISHRLSRSDGFWNDLGSKLYYQIMNSFSAVQFPKGGTDGYLIDREIVDLINGLQGKRNTTPVIEILHLGFDPIWLGYERPKMTNGRSRWTFKKKWKLAMDTFFSGSNMPLRMITGLGFVVFFMSLIIIVAIVFSKLFSDNTLFGLPIRGWSTLVVLVAFFNGMLMLSLGIVAEYLWRMYEEVKGRPPFIIKNENTIN
ncbi:MAG TPA: glycosyltransferase [Saprospiraceae bacterium]|nr:glycosyltransferase [Saprospiraceae bacterium]